jgi:hypothetical protein
VIANHGAKDQPWAARYGDQTLRLDDSRAEAHPNKKPGTKVPGFLKGCFRGKV